MFFVIHLRKYRLVWPFQNQLIFLETHFPVLKFFDERMSGFILLTLVFYINFVLNYSEQINSPNLLGQF